MLVVGGLLFLDYLNELKVAALQPWCLKSLCRPDAQPKLLSCYLALSNTILNGGTIQSHLVESSLKSIYCPVEDRG